MRKLKDLKPGDILPNGAIVIEIKPAGRGHCVLAIGGGTQPYVIWDIYHDCTCEHGRYYGSFELAAFDWVENISL